MRVELLEQAVEDLEQVREPLRSRLLKLASALGGYPELGAPMAGRFAGYRSFVVEMFRVVYYVEPDAVLIAYVRDCRRRPVH